MRQSKLKIVANRSDHDTVSKDCAKMNSSHCSTNNSRNTPHASSMTLFCDNTTLAPAHLPSATRAPMPQIRLSRAQSRSANARQRSRTSRSGRSSDHSLCTIPNFYFRSPDALSALVSRITSPSKSTSTPSRSSNLRPSGSHNALRTIAPSPAAVADAIEEQTAKVSQQVHSMIDKSHVGNLFTDVRDVLSSVVGVEGSVLLLEAFNLQQDLMPWVYAFDFPANPTIHMNSQAVYLPNLFILLTGYYWHATLLWAITCFAIPLIASWFFNLTVRSSSKSHSSSKPRWRCDPFTFNVVKALMIWLVFSQGYTYHGLFSHACVDIVRNSMAGGYAGMLIGAFMGIGASMYVAMQRN